MNSSTLWFLCLLGLALTNQGRCRPNVEDSYPQNDEGDEYDENDDDYTDDTGPPPVIKSLPVVLEVDVGDVAVLPCEVEGNQNVFSRIWRKDSKGLFVGSVSQTNDPRISNLINGSLEIRQIQPSDTGTYNCMISVTGKPQEIAHTLKVKSPAQITSITPNDSVVILKETGSLTLECIAQGHPTPSVKWFKNGHILENQNPSIQGARYTIDSASTDDAGMYKCTATNGQQMPDERIMEVQVHYPPEITIAKEIVTTGEGYESELKCTVKGQKKPEFKWYKSGEQKPIAPSQRIKLERNGHEHTLRILKTQHSDFGDYTCEAKNNEGEASANIRLTGKPSRPVIESVSTDSDEQTKNPVMVFKVESFAPIEEYELLYKKEEKDEWVSVKPVVTPSLDGKFYSVAHTFTDLEPGVYVAQLKAKNNYGWSEFSSVKQFPREHAGDLTQTGLLAITGSNGVGGLRISVALLVSLLVAHFYC